ncbi:MAG: acyl-CoA thioesterase II [Bacteroidota bacterium]
MTNSPGLSELLTILELEQIEVNLFRAANKDIGSRSVFGGQVAAQCLSAAIKTIPDDRHVHSLHGYFILPGDIASPIVFEVDRTRDGRSFTTRRVVAIQHGKAIFHMSASFQLEQPGMEHQISLPDVPRPAELQSSRELMRKAFADRSLPLPKFFASDKAVEFRPVEVFDPFVPKAFPPTMHVWFRMDSELPDDPKLHRILLTYVSDFNLLGTALRPHHIPRFSRKLRMASLDHALWFHRAARVDQWLLYAMDTPSSSGSRAFCRGSIYTEEGILVASAAQEGLMRLKEG